MEFQQKHNNLNAMKKIIGSIIFLLIYFLTKHITFISYRNCKQLKLIFKKI